MSLDTVLYGRMNSPGRVVKLVVFKLNRDLSATEQTEGAGKVVAFLREHLPPDMVDDIGCQLASMREKVES